MSDSFNIREVQIKLKTGVVVKVTRFLDNEVKPKDIAKLSEILQFMLKDQGFESIETTHVKLFVPEDDCEVNGLSRN